MNTTPLMKVLVVDDDQEELAKMGQIFESKGVIVAYAKNGKEATKWLKENGNKKLDAIISDVFMPEMNGIELSLQINNAFPVILVSEEGELPLLTDDYVDLIQAILEKDELESKLFAATLKAVDRWKEEVQIAA